MSDQEERHGHHVTTMHAVRHLFERIPSDELLGQTPQQFFEKLDAAQNKLDGMPGGNIPHLQLIYKAVAGWNERIVQGDGTTVLPSKLAPDAQKAHALSNPSLSSDQNLAAIKSHLVNQLEAAWGAHIEGNKGAEFEHLGKIAHLMVDSYSGAHMLRDPGRPGDSEAPIKALLNFSMVSWWHSNTHTKDFDKVPTVSSSNDLARSTDQAGAEGLGRLLAVYVQNVDSRDPAATHQAFTEIVENFFQADHLVTFNDKHDPSFQQMLAEHYANEVSQSPVVPDSTDQNISAVPSAPHPETSSMNPAIATGNDAVTMPPPDAAAGGQSIDYPQASFPDEVSAAAMQSTDHPQVPLAETGAPAPIQSTPDDGEAAAANQTVPQEGAPAPVQSHEPVLASFPEDGAFAAAASAPNQLIDQGLAASPPNVSTDHGQGASGAPSMPADSGDVAAPAAGQHPGDAPPSTPTHGAASTPFPTDNQHTPAPAVSPDAGHQDGGPALHNDAAAAPISSQPHEAAANASHASADATAPPADQGSIAHPTGGVHTNVRRVTDEHAHRDYLYGHGGSTGQTAHEHAANPHQPHNWQSQNGADIICPLGTPIYAAFDGRIGEKFGVERGHENDGPQSNHHGNRLTIEGASNQAFYQHLDRFADGIAAGVSVHQGQLLGYSGTGGGIHHLHIAFEHGDTDQLLHNAAVADPLSTTPTHHGQQVTPDSGPPAPDHRSAPAADHVSNASPEHATNGHTQSAGHDVAPHNGRFLTGEEYRHIAEHHGGEFHPELLNQHPTPSDPHIAAVTDPSVQNPSEHHSTDGSGLIDPSSAGHNPHSVAAAGDPSHHHGATGHQGHVTDGAIAVDPSASVGHNLHSVGTVTDPSHHHGAAGHHPNNATDGAIAVDPSSSVGHDPHSVAAAGDPSHHHGATGHQGHTTDGAIAVDPSSAAGAHTGAVAGAAHSGAIVDPSSDGHAAAGAAAGGHHGNPVVVDPATAAAGDHADHGAAAGYHHADSSTHAASSHAASAPHAAGAPAEHHDAGAAAHHDAAAVSNH